MSRGIKIISGLIFHFPNLLTENRLSNVVSTVPNLKALSSGKKASSRQGRGSDFKYMATQYLKKYPFYSPYRG